MRRPLGVLLALGALALARCADDGTAGASAPADTGADVGSVADTTDVTAGPGPGVDSSSAVDVGHDTSLDAGALDAGCDGCGDPCPGGCLLDKVCVASGGAHPTDPCLVCGASGFEPGADGAPCASPDACFESGECEAGACVGAGPVACDDGEPCTADACDPASGCTHEGAEGPCDDGDACTVGDACQGGACAGGGPLGCDDGLDCTADTCVAAAGCMHEPLTGPDCDDGDVCTLGDACDGGECLPSEEISCDDGDSCTADACNPFTGCVHLPTDLACEDGDPCTVDACTDGECAHTPVEDGGPCDDGSACTLGDACAGGECQPGAEVPTCDDGNICTVDTCNPAKGCQFLPGPGGEPCDDGVECTVDDVCGASGKCKGTPLDCGPCVPAFSPVVIVATSLQIGADGNPGSGLDVDGDSATCAPPSSCSAGIDNAAAPLGSLVNSGLDASMADGEVAYLVDLGGAAPGSSFELSLYGGELDPKNSGCSAKSGSCAYLVWPSMIDEDACAAVTSFDNATLDGTTLFAGGPTYTFPLSLPILPGANLDITIDQVQIEGTVTLESDGSPKSFAGIIAGAVRKDVLIDAIYQIPADVLVLPPAQLVVLLDALMSMDIDTDGDGAMDAYSVGLLAKGTTATITGVKP